MHGQGESHSCSGKKTTGGQRAEQASSVAQKTKWHWFHQEHEQLMETGELVIKELSFPSSSQILSLIKWQPLCVQGGSGFLNSSWIRSLRSITENPLRCEGRIILPYREAWRSRMTCLGVPIAIVGSSRSSISTSALTPELCWSSHLD